MSFDILDEVKRGIRSPFNDHSFQSTRVIWPTSCLTCGKIIYLWSSAVSCLSCKYLCHRGICMRYKKNKCKHQATSEKVNENLTAPIQTLSKVEENRSGVKEAVPIDSLEPSGKKLSSSGKEAARPPSSISSGGMWRRMVQSLAYRQQSSQKRTEKSLYKVQDKSADSIGLLVRSILSDSTSFPGKACIALHSAYINAKFESNRETLLQCRECLNQITAALFSVIQLGDDDNNGDALLNDLSMVEMISYAVDNYVLRLSHKSMYERAFESARNITEDDDIKLNSRRNERMSREITSSATAESDDARSSPVFCALTLIASEVTPSRKLQHLCDALRVLSAKASHSGLNQGEINETNCLAPSISSLSSTAEAGIAVKTATATENTNNNLGELSEEINTEKKKVEIEVDADTLIDSLVNVITDPSWTSQSESGDSGDRILFCAECCFLETMTMKSEGSWALGMQSYALTTLKQALQSLL